MGSTLLLPPSHRIEVNCAHPKDTLRFKPSGNDKSIYELLSKVKVFRNEDDDNSKIVPFMDLLDIRKFIQVAGEIRQDELLMEKIGESYAISELTDQKGYRSVQFEHVVDSQYISSIKHDKAEDDFFKYLTHLAWHGFHLPARAVLDLWQIAYCVLGEHTNEKNEGKFQAERIARTMLRNAIFRSDMPSYEEKILQDKIMSRSTDSGTILNFEEVGLDVRFLNKPLPINFKKVFQEEPEFSSRSSLKLTYTEDIMFRLVSKNNKHDLPEDVAAWLSILYDILLLVERVAIFKGAEKKSLNVFVVHEVILTKQSIRKATLKSNVNLNIVKQNPKKFYWPAPVWETFLAQEIFWNLWREDLKKLHKILEIEDERHIRILVSYWIICVLKTFAALNHPDNDAIQKAVSASIEHKLCNSVKYKIMHAIDLASILALTINRQNSSLFDIYEDIDKLEGWIKKAINELYPILKQPNPKKGLIESLEIVTWLENKLPLFFSYLYVPTDGKDVSKLCKLMTSPSDDNTSTLLDFWSKNALFFLNDLDIELGSLFPKDEKPANKFDDDADTKIYQKYRVSLGLFGKLHDHFGTLHLQWTKRKINLSTENG
jgi:hypothetical protein